MAVQVVKAGDIHKAVIQRRTRCFGASRNGFSHQRIKLGAAFAVQSQHHLRAVVRISHGFVCKRLEKVTCQEHGKQVFAQY
jgi:hypothetical protein